MVDLTVTGCPESQAIDTHRLCLIFANTDVQSQTDFQGRNFSDHNYCEWEMFSYEPWILCDSTLSETITHMSIPNVNGSLDLSVPWPSSLQELDIEQYGSGHLSDEWNWTSIQGLHALQELDLEDNEVKCAKFIFSLSTKQ